MELNELENGQNVQVKNKNLTDVKISVPGGDDIQNDGWSIPGTVRIEDGDTSESPKKVYFDREGKDPVELTDDFEVREVEEEDDSE